MFQSATTVEHAAPASSHSDHQMSPTSSNNGSPVSLERVPNSKMKVPTPAVQVMLVSPAGTPYRRFTVPYGIPVVVSNAANRRRATSSASCNSGPLHGHPG
jgi:hypothetical protein